jgi:hypothetical protein
MSIVQNESTAPVRYGTAEAKLLAQLAVVAIAGVIYFVVAAVAIVLATFVCFGTRRPGGIPGFLRYPGDRDTDWRHCAAHPCRSIPRVAVPHRDPTSLHRPGALAARETPPASNEQKQVGYHQPASSGHCLLSPTYPCRAVHPLVSEPQASFRLASTGRTSRRCKRNRGCRPG